MIDFGQKVKGCATTFSLQIENILLRKCTSDITAGRAVLYRVMKKFREINLPIRKQSLQLYLFQLHFQELPYRCDIAQRVLR